MSDIIQLLPDHVANQIAAGEVVQRPASVVKELLENAVDAKAKVISLVIKEAGRMLIQVIDDGLGMSQTDCRMAFERHATSKIRTADDLFNLHSNGFRGEALASIAAVAHVSIKTKQDNQEIGSQLVIHGGHVQSQEPIYTQKGTNIEVKNLFYNIPARRNFLKSNTIETRHIIDVFQRIALTYPHLSFSLTHNDQEIYNLKSANLKKRLVHVFGKQIDEKLIPINESTEIIKISGFVTKPSYAKKKRGEQFFFVNDRYIKSQYLDHAVHLAFENLIPSGEHPSYFLYLEVPPQSIDINIHPTKTEIKFDNEKDLYAILRATIKHSLGQYNAAPILDFNRDSNLDTPYHYQNKSIKAPSIQVDRNFNPFSNQTNVPSKKISSDWESLYIDTKREKEQERIKHIEFEYENVTQHLFDKKEQVYFKTYQLHEKYIVSAIQSGLVLIDQNAAHQRILYEDFLAKITIDGLGSQSLLFPKLIQITAADSALIQEIQSDLESSGFHFTLKKDGKLFADSIPAHIKVEQLGDFVDQLINDLKSDHPNSNISQIDTIAKSMAKSCSIKKGIKLSNKEQEDILNKLFLCKEPNYSPFGKKTYITISTTFVEEEFDS
ncbi:DNA mismatch repair endonuclease MutL [Namhaeicola litoreus]|uniref:DNA mismatch repair protein MutL n=1 Tax=Namhaeicola litoreus TaxID=1052145 RepID=A0ABW3Y4D2_9FLAO